MTKRNLADGRLISAPTTSIAAAEAALSSLGPLVAGLFAGTDAVSVVGRLNKPLQLDKPPPPPPTSRQYRHLVSGGRHGSAGDKKHADVTSRLAAIHNAATLHVKSRKRRRAEVEANAIAIETETFVSSAARDKIVKEAEEKAEKERKQKLDEQLSLQQRRHHHHPTPHTTLFSASAIGKSSSSSVTTPAQGSLLALAQALVGGAVRPQATLAAAHSNEGRQQQVVKEISISASTLIRDASKQFITSSTISTVNSLETAPPPLPVQSSVYNSKPPHGGERMRKLRRDIHGWRVAEPGNSLSLHEAYSQWWTAVYAETVKVSVSSGSQPTSKVSGGGGGGGSSAVSLADINAALKERKKEEEMKRKGISLAANQKLKPVKPESKASILPTSLASAALSRAVNLSLVKSVRMRGAWVEVTRCQEQLPLRSLPPQTSTTLLSAKVSSSSSSIGVNDSEVQSSSTSPHHSHHFSGFITWIGSEYFTICSPLPHSLRRVTLKKKGTMLCVRWPSFALKKGERFVTDPPGPIETLVECSATDLLPSD